MDIQADELDTCGVGDGFIMALGLRASRSDPANLNLVALGCAGALANPRSIPIRDRDTHAQPCNGKPQGPGHLFT